MRHYRFLCGPLLVAAALLTAPHRAAAHEGHQHAHATACKTTALACASVATGAFAPDGTFWVTWTAGG
ncbi:MAG TPA: exo-alpha-sialidase, partial [Hyphomicrobium sp.]|nr:exo-alpha-sialidase [Hyphomicrobium sp.]